MPKQAKPLTARKVETVTVPGRYADGNGLYLAVEATGSRRWVFRYRIGARRREMGLGSAADVPLIRARQLAAEHRRELAEGRDPLERREAARVTTFGAMAEELIASLEAGWRNDKHRHQWRMTLGVYAAALSPLPVERVDTAAVLAVLKPLWTAKPETASRLRGRIEAVLNAARAKGHIASPWENPARWRGHLDHLLPARKRLTRGHHAAHAIDGMPAFMAALREREAIAALALEFTILTAARTGEVTGARWDEIDLTARVWAVPAARMKAGVAHRVPLSTAALAVLERLAPLRSDDPLVFTRGGGRPLSGMAMTMLLRRMGRSDVTVHGFRSTFRDWASERTGFPHEVCEMALAHAIANRVEAAYRRGDLLERRRELMQAWAGFLEGRQVDVVRLRRSAPA